MPSMLTMWGMNTWMEVRGGKLFLYLTMTRRRYGNQRKVKKSGGPEIVICEKVEEKKQSKEREKKNRERHMRMS